MDFSGYSYGTSMFILILLAPEILASFNEHLLKGMLYKDFIQNGLVFS
jgi:hypothetical protein